MIEHQGLEEGDVQILGAQQEEPLYRAEEVAQDETGHREHVDRRRDRDEGSTERYHVEVADQEIDEAAGDEELQTRFQDSAHPPVSSGIRVLAFLTPRTWYWNSRLPW